MFSVSKCDMCADHEMNKDWAVCVTFSKKKQHDLQCLYYSSLNFYGKFNELVESA